jgi:sporulation protein YlmC with PRC-barrel domain
VSVAPGAPRTYRSKEKNMSRRLTSVALAAAIACASVSPVALAQGTQQNVTIAKVETVAVANAWRASKIVGAAVHNDAGDKIGTVDDLLVQPQDQVLFAVIAVGGFLGIGDKLVVVPYKSLQLAKDKVTLPGATKEALKDLPKFEYKTS